MLTQEYLKTIVIYDPETGIFIWKVYRRRAINGIGGRADVVHHKGYRQVGIDGVSYIAHRLAWFYMTGVWPTHQIDHINNIKDDNKWINLREATASENMRNRSSKNGKFRGVYKTKEGRFRALICLGHFDTPEEASKAYKDAALKLHGEFAHSILKE